MTFIDGKAFVVTKEDETRPWSGRTDGSRFRCYLCGHRFKAGDVARWQFTNDIPHAGGNPMVCTKCDGTKDEIVAKWLSLKKEYRSNKYWWFKR